jgi:hypothetical protein
MKDINFREALKDPETRPIYIRRTFNKQHLYALLLTERRSPNFAMVDRGICHCYQTVNKKNALWDEISSARDSNTSASVYISPVLHVNLVNKYL